MTPIHRNRPKARPRPAAKRPTCVAIVAVVITDLALPACTHSRTSHPPTITMTAAPTATHDQLIDLAGALVGGPGNLAEPSTGRLPNLNTFRAAGIATLTVSANTIRIVLRDDATTAQQQALLNRLRGSPMTASISSTP